MREQTDTIQSHTFFPTEVPTASLEHLLFNTDCGNQKKLSWSNSVTDVFIEDPPVEEVDTKEETHVKFN
jgi:hypothetical protein